MRLIGLHGRLHSGKDTAFEALSQLTDGVYRRAFADAVKLSGMASLGLTVGEEATREQIIAAANMIKESGRITLTYEDPRFPAKGFQAINITGRQFWQFVGTEGHRDPNLGSSFGNDFWVNNILPPYELGIPWEENFPVGTKVAVITDVRFPNEAQRILDLEGEVWWIDAEERLGPNVDGHESEQKLPEQYITKTIDNNGSVEAFALDVKRAFDASNSE